MASYTEHCGLVKPAPQDFYDIGVSNQNMDTLDRYVAELAEENRLLREQLANKAYIGSPTVYDLELDDTIEVRVNSVCKYWKTSFNTVHVSFFVNTVKGDDSLGRRSPIAILPEGFRPSQRVYGVFTGHTLAASPQEMGAGGVLVDVNGQIIADVIGTQLGAICGLAVFQV